MKQWIYLCIYILILTSKASATELLIMLSDSAPPYVFSNSSSGIVVDLITEAFKIRKYKAKVTFASNRRILTEFKQRHIDGAFATPGSSDVFQSDPIINYQNILVTLKSKKYVIKDLVDLRPLVVTSFQNSSNFAMLKPLVQQNKNFIEISNQASQVPMLLKNRTDAILLEKRIFAYYSKGINQELFETHTLLPEDPRHLYMHDGKILAEFNQGLLELKASGQYKRIIEKYVSQFDIK